MHDCALSVNLFDSVDVFDSALRMDIFDSALFIHQLDSALRVHLFDNVLVRTEILFLDVIAVKIHS